MEDNTKKLLTVALGAALLGGLVGGVAFYGIAAATIPLEAGPQGVQGERGPQGATGLEGKDGKSASVKIGKVTTVAPDKEATVTNTGTGNNAIFDFTIPQGKTGEAGPQGKPGVVTSVSSIPGWPANCTQPTVETVRVNGSMPGQSDYDIMVLSCGKPAE